MTPPVAAAVAFRLPSRFSQGKENMDETATSLTGLTIKDRLQELRPNDLNAIYTKYELIPVEFSHDIRKAKIVITNYHAFKLRDELELSKKGRNFLQGRHGEKLVTTETPGKMLARVMPELLGMKHILVINDEAHHCYEEKPDIDGAEGYADGERVDFVCRAKKESE